MSHTLVAIVTEEVTLTRVSMVPMGFENNCVLEAEETYFITDTESSLSEI